MATADGWTRVWWFPLMQRKTGLFRSGFVSQYGTAYRWALTERVIEESEDVRNQATVQTIKRSDGTEYRHRVERLTQE